MTLLFVIGVSIIVSIGVGYFGVASEIGVQKLQESPFIRRIVRAFFLFSLAEKLTDDKNENSKAFIDWLQSLWLMVKIFLFLVMGVCLILFFAFLGLEKDNMWVIKTVVVLVVGILALKMIKHKND